MSGIRINSNISSLVVQRQLDRASDSLSNSFERLSSGLRINKASDDAAGLAVATQLQASGRVYTQGIRNINDALSMLNIADGAGRELSGILTRVSELAEQAANGTYSTSQRSALDSEAQALRTEFQRIVSTTKFNGITLLDGSSTTLGIETGTSSGSSIDVALQSIMRTAFGDGTFTTAVSFASGSTGLRTLRAGDIDRNGTVDITSVSATDFALWTMLGNSDGTFRLGVSYQTGFTNLPQDAQLVDVNNDTILDVVVTSPTDDYVGVLLGNSNGTFKAISTYYGADAPRRVTVADLNRDGYLDIITASSGDDKVVVLIANNNGTFQAPASYTNGAFDPFAVAVSDLNNDGYADIVTAFRTGGSVGVMFGNSNGTFRASVSYVTQATPSSLSLTDLNGDGYEDLVVGHDGADDAFSILLGNADGSFQAKVSYAAIHTIVDFTTEDVNGDGIPDIVGSSNNSGFQVLIGNGDGSFKAFVSYGPSVNNPQELAVVDVNGDGAKDAIVASSGTGTINVRYGQNSNTFFSLSLTSQMGARAALTNATTALNRLTTVLGTAGAYSQRLEFARNALTQMRDNYKVSESRIMDVDVAEEAAKLTSSQIRQQAASAILAQVNQEPSLVLKLLG